MCRVVFWCRAREKENAQGEVGRYFEGLRGAQRETRETRETQRDNREWQGDYREGQRETKETRETIGITERGQREQREQRREGREIRERSRASYFFVVFFSLLSLRLCVSEIGQRGTRERGRLKRFALGRHIFCVFARLSTSHGYLLGGALIMRFPRSLKLPRNDDGRSG